MEIGMQRTPPLRERPNLQTVDTEAAHLDSGHLDLLTEQARKLYPTVAHYPQVTLVIFGPLPKVRFFLWDTGGPEESLIARLLIQSWARSHALERVVWTDLLRLGDTYFDQLEAPMRECLYFSARGDGRPPVLGALHHACEGIRVAPMRGGAGLGCTAGKTS